MVNRTMHPNPSANRRELWAETFTPALAELRAKISLREPVRIMAASGVQWDALANEFRLTCLDEGYRISWPELVAFPSESAQPCAPYLQGLFLYYLAMADGEPQTNRWISFRELPDGWLYHQAFQGYSGDELARAIGNDIDRLAISATAVGGQRQPIGDLGFAFDALPRLRLALVYWLGDEEFTPRAQVLFDASAGHYLPVDGLAGMGRRLVTRLLRHLA